MRPRRTDGNHAQIAQALRSVGCVVLDVHAVPGMLDLLVARAGTFYLLEVKDGAKSKSRRALTEAEVLVIEALRAVDAPVYVVKDISEAMAAVGIEVTA